MKKAAPDHSRFEDRMKGLLQEKLIEENDMAAKAHKIIVEGHAEAFLAGEHKEPIRETDTAAFLGAVRQKVERLKAVDLKRHILCRHLKEGQVSPLAGEALYWDIKIPDGQPSLDPRAAQAIFETHEKLTKLPKEAHQIMAPPKIRRAFAENETRINYTFSPLYFFGYSLGHGIRTGIYATLIAQKLKEMGRESIEPDIVALTGFLHDIGKIQGRIFDIVRSDKKLTAEDRHLLDIIRLHPVVGMVVWNEILEKGYMREYRKIIDAIVVHDQIRDGMLQHHVRPDGKGYPSGYSIDPLNIPLISRIMAVADCFDAMTSHRKYAQKKENSVEYAYEELKRCSGLPWDQSVTRHPHEEGQFDQDIVKTFLEVSPTPVFYDIETSNA
ncbi:HD domain-containing protein [Candidatus Peregrinibacteria bacterium]|nr:HD domain-containing protein [Candidatus Peregrinibacteria bacterium]